MKKILNNMKKINEAIFHLQSQPTIEYFTEFMDIVGSQIEEELDLKFIAVKAKVVLGSKDSSTWNFLANFFESKKQIYPAICCTEALLLIEQEIKIVNKYTKLLALYNNAKEKEFALIRESFIENYPNTTVSVIMPTYNRLQYIGRAIKSVLNQTFKDFELIIINDGGSRECEEIINSFKSEKIRYLYIEHGGLSHALNQGILSSRSKYIAYLDDDDRYFPEHLQILVKALESSTYSGVYSDGYRIIKNYINGKWEQISKNVDMSYAYNPALFTKQNYIPILNIMHRRDCFERVGLFEEDFPNVMDWDLWYKVSRFYDFKHINKTTSEFEYKLNSDSSLSGRKLDHLFYSILLSKHHQYLSEEVWRDLTKRADLKRLNYVNFEKKILRYSNDTIQLGVRLLPYALTERKFFHAYKLIRQMFVNNFKKTFPIIWKIVPNTSIFNKIIILLFIFLILSENFFKYLAFNITSKFRKVVRLNK